MSKIVAKVFGVMKARFPILRHVCVRKAIYAAEIIKAVCVLHNLCLQFEGDRYNDLNEAYMRHYNGDAINVTEPSDNASADHERNERRRQLINFFA